MYIYLDESGDLGFDFSKSGTSRKFIITLLVCDDISTQRSIKKAVKRTLKNKLRGSKKDKIRKELKGTNTHLSVKDYFFRQIKIPDWGLYTVVLNKAHVYEEFHSGGGQSKLYNFLSRFIIEKLPLRDAQANVKLIVDKSKNRSEILDFNRYISSYIQGLLPLNTGFDVEHLGSHEDAGLQAVDMFCWGIGRKYRLGDTQWYDIFQDKIRFEDEYLREIGA